MASIYKRKSDKGRKDAAWYIGYTDERGRRRTVKGSTDKAATKVLAGKLQTEVELRRRGVIGEADDAFAKQSRRPLAEHLADWHAFVLAKGRTLQHANLSRNRVERILRLAKAKMMADLIPSAVQSALKMVRDGDADNAPVSLRSVHHYTRAVKAFSRWLKRDKRARADALDDLTGPDNPDQERHHKRRALDAEEQAKLVAAAESGPVVMKMTGTDRAILYRVALGTGFRANELRHLTPEVFDLFASPPRITVRAKHSKRRKNDEQPIAPELAEILRPWLATKLPGAKVFGDFSKHTNLMIRSDLTRAGLKYDLPAGIADFHALRHSYITALARSNAPVKVVQDLARHSTPTLTFGVYTHAGIDEKADALVALPVAAAPTAPIDGIPSDANADTAFQQCPGIGNARERSAGFGSEDVKAESGDAVPIETQPLSGSDVNADVRPGSHGPEGGFRDPGREPSDGFQDRPNRPLWHPSRRARISTRATTGSYPTGDAPAKASPGRTAC